MCTLGGAEIGWNWMELASAPNGVPILLQNVQLNTNCIAKKLQKHKQIQKKHKKSSHICNASKNAQKCTKR